MYKIKVRICHSAGLFKQINDLPNFQLPSTFELWNQSLCVFINEYFSQLRVWWTFRCHVGLSSPSPHLFCHFEMEMNCSILSCLLTSLIKMNIGIFILYLLGYMVKWFIAACLGSTQWTARLYLELWVKSAKEYPHKLLYV